MLITMMHGAVQFDNSYQAVSLLKHIMDKSEQMKQEIASILAIQPELLKYEESTDKKGKQVLHLVTISPNKHKTRFLFHKTSAPTQERALKKMYEYVTEHMKEQDTFQIRWHNPKTREIEISWFRASNIMEALGKFYHDGKEVGEYKIYEVSLRPYA